MVSFFCADKCMKMVCGFGDLVLTVFQRHYFQGGSSLLKSIPSAHSCLSSLFFPSDQNTAAVLAEGSERGHLLRNPGLHQVSLLVKQAPISDVWHLLLPAATQSVQLLDLQPAASLF